MQLSRHLSRSDGWLTGALLGVIAAVIGLSSVAAVARQPAVAPIAIPEPWPRFVMLYRDTADIGTTGITVTQTFRVEYSDRRHFSSTVIAHSDPRVGIGYTQRFDGNMATTTDPLTGDSHSTVYGANQYGQPADWLVPRIRPTLLDRPGAVLSDLSADLAAVRASYKVGARNVSEEVRFRRADGIPVAYVQTVDGRVTRSIEVLQLDVLK